ncbi:MAG: HDOD domain-containing protein [Desulfovibrionaceae bacterium]
MSLTSLAPRPGKKSPTSLLVEVLLGFALISAVNIIWFRSDLGFLEVSPHPYWILVLLLSVRYGFLAGVFCGVLAASVCLGLTVLGRHGTTLYELFRMLLGEPLLFILVGAVLGEITQGLRSRYEALLTEHEELKVASEKLKERYDAVIKAKQEVDTRILSQEQTLSTMHETAHALRSLSEAEIYPAALEMVAKFLGAEACSIYLFDKGALHLKGELGAVTGHDRLPERLPDEGLMGRAFTGGKVASVNVALEMYEKGELPDVEVLISAPLVTSGRKPLGVVNIERLPFLKFNTQTIRMAEVFGGWCADALENALLYTDTKSKTITDDITGAYTIGYLHSRLAEECARARRYKTDLACIVLDILGYVEYSEDQQREILTSLSNALKQMLRNIDLLFSGDEPGRYFLLMPNTPLAGAKVVGGKIVQLVAELGGVGVVESGGLPVAMGVSVFGEQTMTPEAVVAAALEDRNGQAPPPPPSPRSQDVEQVQAVQPQDAGFIARQAVFGPGNGVWGYELFYRHTLERARASAEEHRQLLSVATNSFLSPQWRQSPNSYLLVTLDPRIFAEDTTAILPKERTVFQVREELLTSGALRLYLARLREENHRIAFTDFSGKTTDPEVLGLANIVAVDMLRADREDLLRQAVQLKQRFPDLEILAKKVENAELYALAKRAGCTLFQGFFFQKPERISGKTISAGQLASLGILSLVEQPDPDIKQLAAAIQKDVSLSFRLLKFLNSPYFGFAREVSSIRDAIILAGLQPMRTWLRLMLITDVTPKDKPNELVFLSAQRGRFLELVARRALSPGGGAVDAERLQMLGLFSLLDSIFDMPMEEVVVSLPLDAELKDTLCRRPTALSPWVDLMVRFERAQWGGLSDAMAALGADPVQVAACYCESMGWANSVFSYLN